MNRNWPDHWGKGGSSSNPSSDVYMGPSPGSEPEVKALMTAFKSLPNMIGAIDFHSYSQLVLRVHLFVYVLLDPAIAVRMDE